MYFGKNGSESSYAHIKLINYIKHWWVFYPELLCSTKAYYLNKQFHKRKVYNMTACLFSLFRGKSSSSIISTARQPGGGATPSFDWEIISDISGAVLTENTCSLMCAHFSMTRQVEGLVSNTHARIFMSGSAYICCKLFSESRDVNTQNKWGIVAFPRILDSFYVSVCTQVQHTMQSSITDRNHHFSVAGELEMLRKVRRHWLRHSCISQKIL